VGVGAGAGAEGELRLRLGLLRGGQGEGHPGGRGEEELADLLVAQRGERGIGRREREDVEGVAVGRAEDRSLEDVDAHLGEHPRHRAQRAGAVAEDQVLAEALGADAVGVLRPRAEHLQLGLRAQPLEQLQVHQPVVQRGRHDVLGGQQRDELLHLLLHGRLRWAARRQLGGRRARREALAAARRAGGVSRRERAQAEIILAWHAAIG